MINSPEINCEQTNGDKPNAELTFDDELELDSPPQADISTHAVADGPKSKKNPIDEIVVAHPVLIQTREEFDEALERHHEWLESVLNPVKKIGLGRANFSGSDFSGWDLTGVNLSGASLKEVKFVGACLEKANLSACNLEGADFQGAKTKGLKLRRARMKGASFDEGGFAEADCKGTELPQPVATKDHEPMRSQESESENNQVI